MMYTFSFLPMISAYNIDIEFYSFVVLFLTINFYSYLVKSPIVSAITSVFIVLRVRDIFDIYFFLCFSTSNCVSNCEWLFHFQDSQTISCSENSYRSSKGWFPAMWNLHQIWLRNQYVTQLYMKYFETYLEYIKVQMLVLPLLERGKKNWYEVR